MNDTNLLMLVYENTLTGRRNAGRRRETWTNQQTQIRIDPVTAYTLLIITLIIIIVIVVNCLCTTMSVNLCE